MVDAIQQFGNKPSYEHITGSNPVLTTNKLIMKISKRRFQTIFKDIKHIVGTILVWTVFIMFIGIVFGTVVNILLHKI